MRTSHNNLTQFLIKSSFLIFNIVWFILVLIGLNKAKTTFANSEAEISPVTNANHKIYGDERVNGDQDKENQQDHSDFEDQVFYFVKLPQYLLIANSCVFIINQFLTGYEFMVLLKTFDSQKNGGKINRVPIIGNRNRHLRSALRTAELVYFVTMSLQIISMLFLACSMCTHFPQN